ncbi:MAG: hypothetical protein KDA25_00490, partial [Phycisphaerales bacterium]|nr:hypothetical protein [Phycisphaerales bacterium]
SSATAREPWVAERRGADPNAEFVQGRCLDAALVAIDAADRVVGGFLWKWFPGESSRGSHLMSTPAMREVIGARWRRRDVESAPGSSSGPSAPSPSPPDPGDHS